MSTSSVTSDPVMPRRQVAPMRLSNSTFASCSRFKISVSDSIGDWSGLLNGANQRQCAVVCQQPLPRTSFQIFLEQRHIHSSGSSRAQRWPGVRRHHIYAVHLRQCFCVNHGIKLNFARRFSMLTSPSACEFQLCCHRDRKTLPCGRRVWASVRRGTSRCSRGDGRQRRQSPRLPVRRSSRRGWG